MARVLICVMGLGLLSACGIDGEPETPTMGATIGVGPGGVYGAARVGVRKGPLQVTIGAGCGQRYCW